MDHQFKFIAKVFPFVKTFVGRLILRRRWPERNLLRSLTSCAIEWGFADFVTVQYLIHVIDSFVEIVLTPQEVVLGVRMGCLQFLASVILQSSSWHLAKISLRMAWRYRIIWSRHLGLSQLFKISEYTRYGTCWFCVFSSSRNDMISNDKGTIRNVRELNKTITFLGDDPIQRTKICCVCDASITLYGRLARQGGV